MASHGRKEATSPKKPKVKRDDNGKLIINYESRLLQPKQHDSEWRAKKLQQYEKEHAESLKKGKKSMLGYFSPARSASAGDEFVEKSKLDAKHARGKGAQLRSGRRQSKNITGTFGKFISNSSGDPYMSRSQIRAAELRAQKAKRIQAAAFAAGKKKSKQVTDTFSRPRFLTEIDGDADVSELKKKIENAKKAMASPSRKFDNFKQPNFTTAPVKKGGPGTAGVLMPVYGEDNPLKRINQYIESPYSAARDAELQRKKAAEEKLRQVHGDAPKPFAGRVSNKGVATFTKDKELYGEDDDQTQAMIKEKQRREQAEAEKRAAAAAEGDEEPPPQWRPSNPPKKMQYADKKAFFGGSNFEYIADPVPEFQPDAHLRKQQPEGDELPNPAWVPNGSHSHGYKGTSSVVLNQAQLRHQVSQAPSGSARTERSARSSRR